MGDRFSDTGNDSATRDCCSILWVANPEETGERTAGLRWWGGAAGLGLPMAVAAHAAWPGPHPTHPSRSHPQPPAPPDFFVKLLLNDLMKRRINSAYIE